MQQVIIIIIEISSPSAAPAGETPNVTVFSNETFCGGPTQRRRDEVERTVRDHKPSGIQHRQRRSGYARRASFWRQKPAPLTLATNASQLARV